jgi:hypothetical protein
MTDVTSAPSVSKNAQGFRELNHIMYPEVNINNQLKSTPLLIATANTLTDQRASFQIKQNNNYSRLNDMRGSYIIMEFQVSLKSANNDDFKAGAGKKHTRFSHLGLTKAVQAHTLQINGKPVVSTLNHAWIHAMSIAKKFDKNFLKHQAPYMIYKENESEICYADQVIQDAVENNETNCSVFAVIPFFMYSGFYNNCRIPCNNMDITVEISQSTDILNRCMYCVETGSAEVPSNKGGDLNGTTLYVPQGDEKYKKYTAQDSAVTGIKLKACHLELALMDLSAEAAQQLESKKTISMAYEKMQVNPYTLNQTNMTVNLTTSSTKAIEIFHCDEEDTPYKFKNLTYKNMTYNNNSTVYPINNYTADDTLNQIHNSLLSNIKNNGVLNRSNFETQYYIDESKVKNLPAFHICNYTMSIHNAFDRIPTTQGVKSFDDGNLSISMVKPHHVNINQDEYSPNVYIMTREHIITNLNIDERGKITVVHLINSPS